MNEFSTCIEFLLLNHDCVIVPGLGAFLAKQMDSRKSEEDEAFLPPYRTVRFNPQLQEGDSFIKSLCKIYRINDRKAQNLLLDWTTDFHQAMEDQGEVEFGSIGVFTLEGRKKELKFTACVAGVTAPDYYGLDAFHMEELTPELKVVEKPVRITAVKADDKQVTIRINRTLLNYAVAAIAAIVLFMTFSTPVDNSDMTVGQQNTAEMFLPSNLVYSNPIEIKKTETPSHKMLKETKAKVKTQKIEIKAEIKPEAKPAMQAEDPAKYCIVLASMVSKTNGTNYVADLQSRGFKNAEVFERGKMRRVILTGFKTEEEATAKAHELHQQSEFESAWVATLE